MAHAAIKKLSSIYSFGLFDIFMFENFIRLQLVGRSVARIYVRFFYAERSHHSTTCYLYFYSGTVAMHINGGGEGCVRRCVAPFN